MQLRMESYTLRETTDIVNEEFGDSLHLTTVREWIEDRIKPELEETADSYRQHLLDQIAVAKRALSKRVAMGDEKAVGAWTRLLDREMRLTGVEKPHQIAVTTNTADGDALEVQKIMDHFFGVPDSAAGHVIQGEVVRREQA
ncbi:hypothetical protein phiRKBJ001_1 [Streptomyces phage phiRKBJ001]|nr:hypothetical protein phiRKBJ001_1 [Streptomyces phage phiRKBJ001]